MFKKLTKLYIIMAIILGTAVGIGAWQIVTDTNWAMPNSVDISIDTSGGNPVMTVASGNTFTVGSPVAFSDGVSETGGVLKENLIHNSGFDVWTNSTLIENGGAAPVLDGANGALTNNLLTNGAFDSDVASWTAESDTTAPTVASVGSGKTGNSLQITDDTGANPRVYQTITTVVGKLYQITAYINDGTEATYVVSVGSTGSQSTEYFTETDEASNDWTTAAPTKVFEATGASTTVTLQQTKAGSTSSTLMFDSVTLYEVTPGTIAADTLGPDDWYKKSGLELVRQFNDGGTLTHDGRFYALRADSITAGDNIIHPLAAHKILPVNYQLYAGRQMVFGAWVKATTASHAFLQLVDSDTTDDDQSSDSSSYHTGGGDWEWLEVTMAVSANTTEFSIAFSFDNTTTVYISQPMLSYGHALGSGSYNTHQHELIDFNKTVNLTDYNVSAITADIVINLEAQSKGMIPKTANIIHGWLQGKNSSADKFLDLYSESGGVRSIRMHSLIAAKHNSVSFRAVTDANGDIYIDVEDGNWEDIIIEITSVELH